METSLSVENQVDAILSSHATSPRILRKDGSTLTAGEEKSLVLRSENYAVESAGLNLLKELLLALPTPSAKERFWLSLKKKARHPLVPWFFISQGKLLHLLEGIVDEMERQPLDQRLIATMAESLKVEHSRYSTEELEKLGELIGALMTDSQLSGGERSLSAAQQEQSDIAPNYMQTMRAKRDVYKALGTLREAIRAAIYQRMEGSLSDA